MGDQPELRVVGPEDWRLLRDVRLRALADAPTAFGSTLAQAEVLPDDEWQARAGAGRGRTVLAVADGVGVAMGGVVRLDGWPSAFVWGMWTAPASRGQGLGGVVLDDLVAWARGQDWPEVRLHVTEGNAGARALYVGRGFASTGEWEPLREGSDLRIEELRLSL